jgi:hypothetical protein
MARHHAIAAASNAVKLLLENAAATDPDWTGTPVDLYQADDLQKPLEGSKPTLSVYLYRVVLSTVRRDRGFRRTPDGRLFRPSIPLDLHYLVIAWASQAATAHELLGWAIRTLDDTPIVPVGLLNAYRSGLAVFGPDETLELVWEPLSLTDLYDIWQVSTQHQAPSASYVARMVQLDSEVPLDEGDLVHIREFDYAPGPA